MTDLVTGATGFLGLHLIEALRKQGGRVRCVVRDRARAVPLEELGAEVLPIALDDAPALRRAFDGVDRVFHLAGGGQVSAMDEAGLSVLRANNVAPLLPVLHAAREAQVNRLVHFSSISAMGIQLGVRLDETSPSLPKTPHEIAKHESEQVALEAFRRDGVPVVVLRPSMVYGPRDLRSEIPKLVRLARRGLIPMFGGGEGRLPWVYVSDVVDATLAAASRPEAVGQTYIISQDEPYRFADVVQTIASALGRKRGGFPVPAAASRALVGVAEDLALRFGRVPPFTRHRLASITGQRLLSIARARRELGYAPRVELEEGMTRTVRWYVERGLA